VKFHGYLANENAELLRALIHAGAKPHKTIDGEPDPRSRTKRQADALTTVLTTAANATGTSNNASSGASSSSGASAGANAGANAGASAGGDSGADAGAADDGNAAKPGFIPGHGPKAQITVTIDFDALKAATADATGDLVYGDGLSAAAVRRMACDAKVIPVVLGSKSQPLDVGMTIRFVTGPMRVALNARDKGCVVCGAPPIDCEAHHLTSWIDGGTTCVTNLVLLCKRHHIDLHLGHWDIQINDDVVQVTRPDWAIPEPVPRNKYRQPDNTEPGPATRAWPRDTDPRWITADEAARLNPWGETSTADRT
jgi:hypothetical protein